MVEARHGSYEPAVRVVAAVLGTLVPVVLVCAIVVTSPIWTEPARWVVASTLAVPVWVAAMCLGVLARRGERLLAGCAVTALVLYGVLCLVR